MRFDLGRRLPADAVYLDVDPDRERALERLGPLVAVERGATLARRWLADERVGQDKGSAESQYSRGP